MKLTDYVIEFLVAHNIDTIFGLTGGAVVHFFDSADKNESMHPVFCHHEQAAALAAVSYARGGNRTGAAVVTTGPGGTNTITGVTSAWQDSIPCLFISGQSRKDHVSYGKKTRQVGAQELNIVDIVKPITNYAAMLESPTDIRCLLEKALYLSNSKRPGPVWIDIPVDFQWVSVEHDSMLSYDPEKECPGDSLNGPPKESCQKTIDLLGKAKRPLLLVGYGVSLSRAEGLMTSFVEDLGVPFVTTWGASDIFDNKHPLNVGRLGVAGQRGANLAVQNCDLLLVIGSHLSIPLTGTNVDAFARDATIIVVNIDKEEIGNQSIRIDYPVCCDAKKFLFEISALSKKITPLCCGDWLDYCVSYTAYNHIQKKRNDNDKYIDQYQFVDTLSDLLDDNDTVVVDGGGTNVYITFQSFKVKKGQRLLLSTGICAMGTGLPESIGVSFTRHDGRVICLCGDGSMQLNIQELQTIIHHDLNIKIFVMNNDGYLAIRNTQDGFLDGNYIGADSTGGVSLPDYKKVAGAYGMETMQISVSGDMIYSIQEVLQVKGPVLCEVMISPNQEVIPRQGFRLKEDGGYEPLPLEDMYPFLDQNEFEANMIVKTWGVRA